MQAEINHISESLNKLLMAQTRFRECANSVNQLTSGTGAAPPAQPGQPLLVPLTSSLYVPGRIPVGQDAATFMVDVGTGYYVEKNGKDAEAFFTAKTAKLDENMTDLKKMVDERMKNFRVIQEALKKKIVEEQQLLAAQKKAAAGN